MNLLDRWLYALKIKSWPKLLVPFFFGQAFGMANTGLVHPVSFLAGFAFTVFLLIYIVLLNDFADVHVDTVKRTLFPNDCSPKTIPDLILPQKSVLITGIVSALLCVLTSVFIEFFLHKPYVIGFSLLCIFVFAAYSLPPIRLNYRGGGEFLEMIGVGFMLPVFHFYLQSNLSFGFHFCIFLILSTLFALASALASGLSDEVSDKEGGKFTFVTLFGNGFVRKIIESLLVFSVLYLLISSFIWKEIISPGLGIVTLLYLIYHVFRVLQRSKDADTNRFEGQRIYKDHIHKAIWGTLSIVSGYEILISIKQLVQI